MPSLPRGGGEELAREEQVSSRKVSFLFQWYTANIFRWFVSEYCGFLHRDNLKTTWTSCLKCQCIETTMQQYVYIWIMYNISVGMLFFTCINKSFFSSIDGIYWCESAVLHSWFGTKRLVRALCLLAKNVLIIIYKYILAFFFFVIDPWCFALFPCQGGYGSQKVRGSPYSWTELLWPQQNVLPLVQTVSVVSFILRLHMITNHLG